MSTEHSMSSLQHDWMAELRMSAVTGYFYRT